MVEIFDNNFPSSIDKKGLKRYSYVINRKESHIIRIKNPFLKAKCFRKIKKNKERNIIISIDNSRINFNLENKEIKEEKKEEEKEIGKNDKETEKYICNINEEDKQNLNLSENLNEVNMKVDYEKNNIKLKRPILIR
jgi:sensor c-di-GMP phosphodiesterase-like protein